MTPFLTIPLVFVLIVGAIGDYRTGKIPNVLTFPSLMLALAIGMIIDGSDGFLFGFKGFWMGMLTLIIPYLLGVMGAGDVKLMGVVGAFLGVKGVLNAFLLTTLCGGGYAIIIMMINHEKYKGFLYQQWLTLKMFYLTRKFLPDKPSQERPKLYYGLAIASGTILFLILDLAGFAPII